MFKVGDRIVCININGNSGNETKIRYLSIGKTYVVLKSGTVYDMTCVTDDRGTDIFSYFYSRRFLLLKEYRKQKIQRLCLKWVIK